MRVSTNSMANQFLLNVNNVNARIQKDNIQLTTGKALVDLSDDPNAVANIQYYDQSIANSTNYMNTASQGVDELTTATDALDSFSSSLLNIKQTATAALSVDNSDKLPTMGQDVMTMLKGLIDLANTDYNGTYVFAGTKNTAASLTPPVPPATNSLPFELVQETPTSANPCGLRVMFKGNTDARTVNTGPSSTEQVNATADEVFGSGGTDVFNKVIDLYNQLNYRADGSKRDTSSQPFTPAEQSAMESSIQQIGNAADLTQRGTGAAATRLNRLQAVHDQMSSDISRTEEIRSSVQDVDVAQTIMNLNKDQMSLQYALQSGSKMFSQSLMDFLG